MGGEGDHQGIVQEIQIWIREQKESNRENETTKILWNFEIHTHHLISAKRPDQIIVNKNSENLPNGGLCRSSRLQSKIEGR